VAASRFAGALASPNRLKLGTFSTNLQHGGFITSLPGTLTAEWPRVRRLAQMTDAMGLELIVPVARWKGYGGRTNFSGQSFDTFCWAAGLAAATEYPHIFSTVHVPTMHPIVAAKQLTTIDHLSGGRAGLNVVGGWYRPELEMFGPSYFLEHDRRYDLAEEWLQVITRLWTIDGEFDYDGEFFQITGGFSEPKPIQRPTPPIMNAGGSPRGQRFAAQYSDMIFVHIQDDTNVAAMREQVERVKTLAQDEFDRDVQVWGQSYVVCRETEREARSFWNHYVRDLGDTEAADNLMHFIGLESEVLGAEWNRARDRFISGWGGTEILGAPEQVVERFAELAEAGLTGTVLLFPLWEEGLEQFREQVLPLLEDAGLREPYAGSTDRLPAAADPASVT
jgi:alkanesulfonate monooxygenase SsuD/methylene tetrahydromethanopterin reductase-like flavin-dependent oxidoreductase (luciferase family)